MALQLLDHGKLLVSIPGCQPAHPASWYQPWGRRAARLRRGWCSEHFGGDGGESHGAIALLAACSANNDAVVQQEGGGESAAAAVSHVSLLQEDRVAALGIRVALLHKQHAKPYHHHHHHHPGEDPPKPTTSSADRGRQEGHRQAALSRLALAEECFVRRWGTLDVDDPKSSKVSAEELVPREPAVEALAAIAIAAASMLTTTSGSDVVEGGGGDAGSSGCSSGTINIIAPAAATTTTTTTATITTAHNNNASAITTLINTVARLEQCVGDVRTVLSPVAIALLEDVASETSLSLSFAPSPTVLHGSMVQEAARVAVKGRETVVQGRRPEALHGCVMLDSNGTVVSTGYNHTIADRSQLPPGLLDALPKLQGMVGDHRQWQRAWDKGAGKEKGRDHGNGKSSGKKGGADARLSFHAEQHAVLQAAAAGTMDSLRGGSCYIVEVDNVDPGMFAEAYPCSVCWPLVKHCGLRYVYFTTPSGLKQLDFGPSSGSLAPSAPSAPSAPPVPSAQHLVPVPAPVPAPALVPAPVPAFSLDKETLTGIVKETAMRKFGFITADDAQLGDVFFPLCVLNLSGADCNNPDLKQFPDGSPMLHAPFRSFLCGRRVAFQLEVDHTPTPATTALAPSPASSLANVPAIVHAHAHAHAHATESAVLAAPPVSPSHVAAVGQQHVPHRIQRPKRPKRPQASVVTPCIEGCDAIP